MIHRTKQGQLVEVVRASFKNDKLYYNHLYSLLSQNNIVPSVSLVHPISVSELLSVKTSEKR